ncbi:MAG: hypothetical protein ABSG57_00190 [Candidatus Bathyarchaeia archaeon]
MNAKKELLATSLLAIALAVGLGTLSFGLFSEAPPNVQIGVSAKKNGATSLSFLPQDQVLLEAQVSSNNASVAGAPVTFEVESPNGTDFLVLTANTDSLGTANVTFQIPWPIILSPQTTWELGTWQAQATIQIYGQTQNASTNFNCETVAPTIDMYTNKGGHGPNTTGGTFTTNETVRVYIETRNELNKTASSQLIGFQESVWGGGSNFNPIATPITNASGIATLGFNPTIPDTAAKYMCIATWTTVFNFEDINVTDAMTFTVQLGP